MDAGARDGCDQASLLHNYYAIWFICLWFCSCLLYYKMAKEQAVTWKYQNTKISKRPVLINIRYCSLPFPTFNFNFNFNFNHRLRGRSVPSSVKGKCLQLPLLSLSHNSPTKMMARVRELNFVRQTLWLDETRNQFHLRYVFCVVVVWNPQCLLSIPAENAVAINNNTVIINNVPCKNK